MKFQIECNRLPNAQSCLICHQQFQMREARLIICNDQGDSYGDACPDCIARGATWIGSHLQQSDHKNERLKLGQRGLSENKEIFLQNEIL